jgi:predicted Zn-dependent peptidase
VKLKKPPYKPIQSRSEAVSEYASAFEKIPQQEMIPAFIDAERDVSIANDYFYYTKNPVNDIFTLRLSIAGGVNKDGMYPLLGAALKATGTDQYPPGQLKKEFAKLGCSYSFEVDYNSFDITFTGIDGKFNQTVELLKHLLTSLEPTEQTVEYLYNQRTTENKLNLNNPSSGGRILYHYGLFGEGSSYKKRLSEKELKKLDPAKLKEKAGELLANGFSSIHYIGQNDQKAVRDLLLNDDFFRKNSVDHYVFQEAQNVNETTIYLVNDKKAIQSYVYYIVNGKPTSYKEQARKAAFNAYYTNDLSGILFQEVREFRSLAYSTGGRYIDPIYESDKNGRLVLFTGSQADKTTDAVEVVLDLIRDMPVYENRIDVIKEGIVLQSGSDKPAFRNLSAQLDTYLKTGFKEDPNKFLFENAEKLTIEDIQSFYASTIKGKPVIVTIYGDASAFDMDKLNGLGKVVELKVEEILKE